MDLNSIKTVGVVGAGIMGRGIARVFAEAKFKVYLFDTRKEKAEQAKNEIATKEQERIEKEMQKRAKRRKNEPYSIFGIKAEADKKQFELCQTLNRIYPEEFPDYACFIAHKETIPALPIFFQLDFVVEAAFEKIETKMEIFKVLDECCRPEVILATNTSSLKIADIAEAVRVKRRPKVIGMHFMNPPRLIKLLEIIRSDFTPEIVFIAVEELAKKIGREPIIISRDSAGFICNRNLMPSLLESLRCLEDGVGSAKDIDDSIMVGVGGAMGPLGLGDLIGWDIVLDITKVLCREFGSRYEPPKILLKLVSQGYLGRKVKKGIFDL